MAVGLLTERVATNKPTFNDIMHGFNAGMPFLTSVALVNEHCNKFFDAMYKTGGNFSLAANTLRDQLKQSLLKLVNVP